MKIIVLIFLVSFEFVFNAFGQVKLDDGLLMYLPLNKDVKDYSPNNFHGEFYGETLVFDEGYIDTALLFNNFDDSKIKDFVKLPNITSDELSISFWFKHLSNPPKDGENDIITLSDPDSDTIYKVAIIENNKIVFKIGNSPSHRWTDAQESQFTSNDWNMYSLIISSDSIKTFLNSQLTFADDLPFTLNITDYLAHLSLFVTADKADSSTNFHGLLDELRLYDRPLSEEEIIALYNLSPAKYSVSGIVLKDELPTNNAIVELFKAGDTTRAYFGMALNGNFIINDVERDNYMIRARSIDTDSENYLPMYYNNKRDSAEADLIRINAHTRELNFNLTHKNCTSNCFFASGSIFADGREVNGRVLFYNVNNLVEPVDSVGISSNTFYASHLPLGSYFIHVIPDSPIIDSYYPSYFHNKVKLENADTLLIDNNLGNIEIKLQSRFTNLAETINASNSLKLYPNPAQDIFYIHKTDENEATLFLYDVFGDLLISRFLGDSISGVDISELPYGLYVVKIETRYSTQSFLLMKSILL